MADEELYTEKQVIRTFEKVFQWLIENSSSKRIVADVIKEKLEEVKIKRSKDKTYWEKIEECPECGCKEYLNRNLVGNGYRVCKNCHQEWWVDIDYSKPVKQKKMKGFHNRIEIEYWWSGDNEINPEIQERLENHATQRVSEMIQEGYREGELVFEGIYNEQEVRYDGWWNFKKSRIK